MEDNQPRAVKKPKQLGGKVEICPNFQCFWNTYETSETNEPLSEILYLGLDILFYFSFSFKLEDGRKI